jgi:signal peptidase I
MNSRKEWLSRSRGTKRSFVVKGILFVLLLFVVFVLVETFLLTSMVITSSSMEPTLQSGERLFATPLVYGPDLALFQWRLPGFRKPARGDLVVVTPNTVQEASTFLQLAEPLVSFFTLRRVSLLGDQPRRWVVKRVLGVPGDTVRVEDFSVLVRPAGESEYLPEAAVANRSYETSRDGVPEGWTPDLPLSGRQEDIHLAEGEYFVVGDNRTSSLDSRHWGPVTHDSIHLLIFFRYWPLSRAGRP